MMRAPRNPASDTGNRLVGGPTYYLATTTAWTLYGVLQYILPAGPGDPRVAIGALAWCSTGLLGTHLLARLGDIQGWRAPRQRLVLFVIGAFTLSLAMDWARAAAQSAWSRGSLPPAQAWALPAHIVQALLVIAVWFAVVVTISEVTRRRSVETEALQLALLARTSQLHALRSQLNPHFLFNSLNSVRELIAEDPPRAMRSIDLLSALLRYTLRADRTETVPLADELQAVNDYLALEQVRYDDRLRVRTNIDPDSLVVRLPPMLLQTLVENAVKHGFAPSAHSGEIAILTALTDGYLRIEVTNTGSMSEAPSEVTGIGLRNARERLKLMYGGQASLTVGPADRATVRAALEIPLAVGRLHA